MCFSALLKDAAGLILLVRPKGSLLWTLPGGGLRVAIPSAELLAAHCRRQVGVTPDFFAPLFELSFAGTRIAVGVSEVSRDAVRACGSIEAATWFRSDALPVELTPAARLIIVVHFESRVAANEVGAPALPFAVAGS